MSFRPFLVVHHAVVFQSPKIMLLAGNDKRCFGFLNIRSILL